MISNMIIRKMTVDDVEIVKAMGDSAPELSVTEGNSSFWSIKRLTQWVRYDSDVLLVAEHDKEVVGFLLTQIHSPSSTAYLSDIAVAEDARGEGVGSALIEYALEQLKLLDITYIYGLTQEHNIAIHSLLSKQQFERGEKMIWFDKRL